ncbi:MAG TPA: hypothetical protein DCZ76_00825 [Treponema sp.]|nr:hypothetical protein [Treponema sp.]
MPLYWLARKWWAKTAPCQLLCNIRAPLRQAQGAAVFFLRLSPSAEPVVAMSLCQHAPSTGSGSNVFFCVKTRSLSLSKGTYLKKMILGKNGVLRHIAKR